MKYATVIVLLALLFVSAPAFPQSILRIVQDYVLVDIDENSGLRIGDETIVYRDTGGGSVKQIGRVRLVRYGKGKCACKIVAQKRNETVRVGDFIRLPSVTLGARAPDASPSGGPGSIGIERGDKEVGFMGFWSKMIGNELTSAETGMIRLSFGYHWTDRLQVGAAPQWIITASEGGGTWYFFSVSFFVNYNLTTSSKMVPYITGEWFQENFYFGMDDILSHAYLTLGGGLRNFFNEYAALNTSIKYGFSLGGEGKRTVLTITSGVSVIF